MPWFKIDDGFHCHPKIMMAGNAAIGLYVRCGSYCSQQLTDGLIPGPIAKQYGTRGEIRKLLDHNLWEQEGDDFRIPDYLEFNPSKEKVQADRAAAAERQRRAREKAASRRDTQRDEHRDSHGSHTASHGPPDPTRPERDITTPSSALAGSRETTTPGEPKP